MQEHEEETHEAIKIAILPLADGEEETLHAAEAEGEHALEQTCVEVEIGETITPAEDTCFELHRAEGIWQTPFHIDASGTQFVAVFSEHMMTEYGGAVLDDEGEEVAALHTIPELHYDSPNPRWGPTMGAALLVWLCTLIGPVKDCIRFYSIPPIFCSGTLPDRAIGPL